MLAVCAFMKTTRIQLGMEWVRGPLKFQLMMTTVTRMLTVFMMKVNSKYCTTNQSDSLPTVQNIHTI